jgi:hypothetical protein
VYPDNTLVEEKSMDPQQTPQPNDPSTAAPATPPAAAPIAWEQYLGHIVRWEDGTTWFVLRDGRHWIPDEKAYNALTATGAQVFNLAAPQLDAIPDIKGSHISVTG